MKAESRRRESKAKITMPKRDLGNEPQKKTPVLTLF